MSDDAKSSITVDYLIDLISSIKAALHNTDSVGTQNNEILSEISENVAVLTELYKRQGQDQRIIQTKLEEVIRTINDLTAKIEIHKQQILSSNDSLGSTVSVISEIKKGSIDEAKDSLKEIRDSIVKLQSDLTYIKTEKEIRHDIKIENEEINQKANKEPKPKNWFSRLITFLKTLIDGVSGIYKVLLVATILLILILLGVHIITWNDVTQLIGIKLFQ